MQVIKVGGGCLRGADAIVHICQLIARRAAGHVVVVSALGGITDLLIDGMRAALADENAIESIIGDIQQEHLHIAERLMPDCAARQVFAKPFAQLLTRLERYYYGLNFTGEISPKSRDGISSFGERFSAMLLTAAIQAQGVDARCLMPPDLGLLTDGKYGDATARMDRVINNLSHTLKPAITAQRVIVIPGFYGISEQGHITTFGRGGSDYSAAVIAAALGADELVFWKNTAGFMSADPAIVPDARLIPRLSHEEAAELAYFGAKILHPRAMEPVRRYGIQVAIKNTHSPDAPGSLVTENSPITQNIIKSVTKSTDIGILKVHASGVGARPGILADVASRITGHGINIKSVVTSQTCISLLLDSDDLNDAYTVLNDIPDHPFRAIETETDLALLSIVGQGLAERKGIAARCFSAIEQAGINVEMIAFGPSQVALYFIVRQTDLQAAVRALHATFF